MKHRTPTNLSRLSLLAVTVLLSIFQAKAHGEQTWRRVNLIPRWSHAMVFDQARGTMLMFGGTGYNCGINAQTWVGVDGTWTQLNVAGPPISGTPQMVYDTKRQVVVLFTGFQTWEWNGDNWIHRDIQGPSARSEFAMAYDTALNRTLLFGGRSGQTHFSDLWSWDGEEWTELSASGPARSEHAMSFDEGRQRLVVFGGRNASFSFLGDTWEWDGESWAQVNVAGPRARSNHAMTYNPKHQCVYLMGGEVDGYDSALWRYDGTQWTFVSAFGPTPRAEHAMFYDNSRQSLVLFGGYNGVTGLGDLWEYVDDESTNSHWALSSSFEAPSPRGGHVMAFDSDRNLTVMFGGDLEYGLAYLSSETWEWDGANWQLRGVAGPTPRTGAAMAYDSARHVCVLFGGYSNDVLADTWEWDGDSWSHRSNSGPSPRLGHKMVYDSTRKVTVLFGGQSNGANQGGTWEWNGESWVLRNVLSPQLRAYHAMCFDESIGATVLHGGLGPYSDTWVWDGIAWDLKGSEVPSARYKHAMVYDSVLQKPILFGGFNASSDTWQRTASLNEWSLLDVPEGPLERYDHAMAFDTLRNVAVLFGGGSGDTWELGTKIIGDITANGIVDVDDLLAVVNAWGTCANPNNCPADIAPLPSGNGVVDVDDLLMVINNWTG